MDIFQLRFQPGPSGGLLAVQAWVWGLTLRLEMANFRFWGDLRWLHEIIMRRESVVDVQHVTII